MKVLCLYSHPWALSLFNWLNESGCETVLYTEKLTADWCRSQKFDLAVSYTYPYILSEDVLFALRNNAVNLHNSFLPWNRGKDPSLWSIAENTPRGVSLHYMSVGLDKGDIIAQRLVPLKKGDTLKTSYFALDKAAKEQFIEAFRYYDYWVQMRKKPLGRGNYHSSKDGEIFKRIVDNYDMSIEQFRELLKREM